jgi:hypothetical protein
MAAGIDEGTGGVALMTYHPSGGPFWHGSRVNQMYLDN